MLRIRQEQYEILARYCEHDFVERLVKHLLGDFGAEIGAFQLDESELRPLLCEHIERARKYGVRKELDLTTFIECIALLGPDFDLDIGCPFAYTTLNRTEIDGTEKMNEISEYLVFTDADGPTLGLNQWPPSAVG
mgnify:FL=1